ncbi:hypothetical protein ACIHCM_32400 [Streptomyces sp. NPDC052023]|uniref:hypothetical protein n=1 Tax=Streptomyces sp. NPDC052023 TaxID=3365681 RepID=UPI0037CE9C4E
MRNSPGSLPRRATVCVLPLAATRAPSARTAAPRPADGAFGPSPVNLATIGPFTRNGDRGHTGDALAVSGAAVSDTADVADDVLNPTISGAAGGRVPSYANTVGHDPDVFDLPTGFRSNDNQSACRLVSQRDAAWAGVLFVAADIRP